MAAALQQINHTKSTYKFSINNRFIEISVCIVWVTASQFVSFSLKDVLDALISLISRVKNM